MRRLVLCLIALLAIVTVVRAYTQAVPGITLSPGMLELTDGRSTVGLAFGLAAAGNDREGRRWGVLPVRIEYRSGNSSASLSLNALSLLLAARTTLGRPVVVDRPVTGDVVSAGGRVTVSSRVDGDVWALGADVVLRPTAQVTGEVVAIGGTVTADRRARVAGGVRQLPALKLPLVGALGTRFSGLTLALARQIALYALEALVLLLLALYMPKWLAALASSSARHWRQAALTVLLAIVVVPALVLLLVASVAGLFLLPLLALGIGVLAGAGALGLCSQLGGWMRKGGSEGTAGPLYLFTSGLLGLLVIKAPGIAGLLVGAVNGTVAATAGEVLRLAGLAAGAILLAGGFGIALAHARAR